MEATANQETGLESIANRKPPRRTRKGMLPKRTVRWIAFCTISASLFAGCMIILYGIWVQTIDDVHWRALASMGVISVTMGAFAVVNELLGTRVDEDDE